MAAGCMPALDQSAVLSYTPMDVRVSVGRLGIHRCSPPALETSLAHAPVVSVSVPRDSTYAYVRCWHGTHKCFDGCRTQPCSRCVLQDIFRRYPNRFESVISELCAALEVLEEPDAKAAMVWIIGEFAQRIDNADELLSYLLDNFLDEPVPVQLQLLTAAVKLFLKKPGLPEAQTMISTVLTAATQQSDNPDLRDRAYLYWRLLSSLPEVRP